MSRRPSRAARSGAANVSPGLHALAVFAHAMTHLEDAELLTADDAASSAQLRLLALLQSIDPDAPTEVLTSLDLAGADADVLQVAEWMLAAPPDVAQDGARILEARRRPRIEPFGACDRWLKLVRSGAFDPVKHRELHKVACMERNAIEWAGMGLYEMARRELDEALAIVYEAERRADRASREGA